MQPVCRGKPLIFAKLTAPGVGGSVARGPASARLTDPMTARYRCSDPLAGDFEFDDAESVLDALEAALVAPDTPMLDTVRQTWQPVAQHPEIVTAWAARTRFGRPKTPGLTLPELPSQTAEARPDDELSKRRLAFARLRAGLPALPVEAKPRVQRLAVIGVIWVLLTLALIGWGVLAFASRLASYTATHAAPAVRSEK
jgi:hypothetical protein